MTAPAQPTPYPRLTYNAEGKSFTLDREDPAVRVDCCITPSYFNEALAAEIAKRYNAHAGLVAFAERAADMPDSPTSWATLRAQASALLAEIRGER